MPKTTHWPPKSAPRLFVDTKIEPGDTFDITANAGHYLARVMRITPGDAVVLCDNQTGEWEANAKHVDKRSVSIAIVRQLRPLEKVPDLWLCPALLKKDRFDLVLEKATELGAARIQPVITRRCVADKLNSERARTITTEAAEQCARTALPELKEPQKLAALLKDWPQDRALFFADEEGGAPAADTFAEHAKTSEGAPAAILIGPEGGFDDAERAAIRALTQARPITLGPRILRGETAAIAALGVWMAVAGDWDKGSSPDKE